MGLLDDAIREHLELKRQHGADPTEVEEQEREALGAQQQAEFAATPGEPPVEGAEAPVAEQPPAAEETRVLEDRDELGAEEPADVPDAPEPGRQAPAPGYDEDPWLEEERDEVPAGESLSRPEPEAPAQQEPEAPAPQQEGEEDVLEETPEFLQETPEHERLWFEQRPPRDFDFDN